MASSTVERLNHRRRLRQQATHNHDIVVIGGSAGAQQALTVLLPDLPVDLPAAVFLVVHTIDRPNSYLADVLAKIAPLPVVPAEDGASFRPGHIYVAQPNHHLLFDGDRMALRRGPRENLVRPAIDVLFRSAAAEFGSRVIGVLLSGLLSDGSAGLRAIARCGGGTVVQDPEDAREPEMPRSALEHLDVDHAAPASKLATLIAKLAAEAAGPSPPVPEDVRLEARMAREMNSSMEKQERLGRLSELTCPECGGVVWEIDDAGLPRFRCHTGHAFDADSLLAAQGEAVERALWSALRAHEERLALLRRLAAQSRRSNSGLATQRWEELIADHETHADAIRRVIVEDRTALRSDRAGPARKERDERRNSRKRP
jgi:two-component system chemotaxis response regulator CheB